MTENKQNKEIFSYVDLMIETATGTIGPKRWTDLKKNLTRREQEGYVYLTPKEAEGIITNAERNKKISRHTVPQALIDLIEDAIGDDEDAIEIIPEPDIDYEKKHSAIRNKPSATEHSIADIRLKEAQMRLCNALTDLSIFCLDWAQEFRESRK